MSYKPLKWISQWTESLSLVPSLFRGRISHHFLSIQNVFVHFDNPKEGHLMEYWLSAGFLFRSHLGKSAIITSTSASLRCAFISWAANLVWRTDHDLALGDVDVLVSILPRTYPYYWNALSHVIMDTPLGDFSIFCCLLEQYIAYMSNSFVTYSSVKPCK